MAILDYDYFADDELDPDGDNVEAIIYVHPSWDMALIIENDGGAHSVAMDLLGDDHKEQESLFQTRTQMVSRRALEHLAEFDG